MKQKILLSAIFACLTVQLNGIGYAQSQQIETSPQKTENQKPIKYIVSPQSYEYKKPKKERENQVTRTQGKRGGEENKILMQILAPEDHVARTIKPNPEFWLHISEQPSSPLRYNIIRDGETIWTGEIIPKSNLFRIKYPENLPPLTPGIYVLGVGLGCPENCSGVRIAFEIVPNSNLQNVVKSTIEIQEKIKLFAKEGYWFDAQSLIITKSKLMD